MLVSTAVPQSTNAIAAPSSLVTKAIPNFTCKAVLNGQIQTFSSSSLAGKYWVLFFYPLDFTFVCPTEIIQFSEKAEEFKRIGCEVVGCSVDSEYSHLAWTKVPRAEGGLGSDLKIPLLADLNKKIAESFGVLLPESGIALRGLFVIDPKGIVRHSGVNDLPIGRNVDETLRLVQAIQYFDTNGEVCPANWRPGKRTINTSEPSKYFKAASAGEE